MLKLNRTICYVATEYTHKKLNLFIFELILNDFILETVRRGLEQCLEPGKKKDYAVVHSDPRFVKSIIWKLNKLNRLKYLRRLLSWQSCKLFDSNSYVRFIITKLLLHWYIKANVTFQPSIWFTNWLFSS